MAADADLVKWLGMACTTLGGVVVFLFHKLEASNRRVEELHKQLYDDARHDAETDKDIADSLRVMTSLMQQPRTNGGGSTDGDHE